MGWVIAVGLAIALMLSLLVIGRIPRVSWEIVASAIVLGLAGYAWQGHPTAVGSPRATKGKVVTAFDEKLVEKRRAIGERYGPAGQWLMMSDALARQGHTKDAANIVLSGIRSSPDDANLWVGLGNALMVHGDGALSPSAEFAFRKAVLLDPDAPAPRYFYGRALAEAGDYKGARFLWNTLLSQTPRDSEMRRELENNIRQIDAIQSESKLPR